MRHLASLSGAVCGLLLLLSPLAAQAELSGPRLLPELGSAGDAKDSAAWGASLALHLGLGGSYDVDGKSTDAAATLGVTPVLERRLGPNFAVGFEWMFLWTKADDYDGNRTKVWAPHLRARIGFPVYPKVEVGALLAIGLGVVMPDEGDTEIAVPSYRFAFGGSYQFNDQVRAFADLGYLSMTWGQSVLDRDIDVTFSTVLLSAGLMAVF